ncbi:TraB/GumN family protein [Biostraticola tofi]|uniref:TraB family protein n=1 Tax=Biostraticola tofi TaxID=466109 RepID=A0A4R3YT11_9GAMM|nr:TraB/GumN family protein [Biostraticola tofi]TCV94444.1 hypothetical protein EDC52_107187 [Biostraticola tofi]
MTTFLWRLASLLGLVSPAVYAWPGMDITLPADRQLHLVGSIHMGTAGMAPLPIALVNRLEKADALIVEADITASPPLAPADGISLPLEPRLTPRQRQTLESLISLYHLDRQTLEQLPAWQIALTLQARQAGRLGLSAEFGIDYQLIEAAKEMGKPIIELEGPEEQLNLLLQLPEQGLSLLHDTLDHWHTNARLLQVMIGWWLDSRPVNIRKAFPDSFSNDLYQYLMTERNMRWKSALLALPDGDYLVAVGAQHLYGSGNLPDLLAQRDR